MPHRGRHRVDVAWRPGHRLRQHPSIQIEHAGRDIARLPRRGAERGAHQCLSLLLDNRKQPVPHDLHFDLGDIPPVGHADPSSIIISPP